MGNNIFGITISIGYKYGIRNNFGIGVNTGKGFFQYKIGRK